VVSACANWRFAKARPEPDFRYFSKRTAVRSLENSNDTTSDQTVGAGMAAWTVVVPIQALANVIGDSDIAT
jgi:hypothetical protein